MTSEGLLGLQTPTRHPLLVKVPEIIALKQHKQFFRLLQLQQRRSQSATRKMVERLPATICLQFLVKKIPRREQRSYVIRISKSKTLHR